MNYSPASSMDPVDRMVLQKNWTYLLDSLDIEDVIPYLIQELILDFDMVEEIEAAETKKQKTRRLLTQLMRRGPTAYKAFRKSLLELEVYNHLVQRLDSTKVDPAMLPISSSNKPQSGTEQPDLGITQMDEDPPSHQSTVCPQQSSVQQTPPPPQQQQLPQPPQPSLPPANGNSNFRIAGNNNFVILGSNNTQVYYH